MSPVGQAGDQGPPPADHSGPPSSGSNDEPMKKAPTAPFDGSCEWSSWKQVPGDPREVARHGPWFLEVFYTARLTASLKSLGARGRLGRIFWIASGANFRSLLGVAPGANC